MNRSRKITLEPAAPAAPVVVPDPRSAMIGITATSAITKATIETMITSMMYARSRAPKPANVTPGAGPALSAGGSHETIGVVGACSGESPVGFVIGSLPLPGEPAVRRATPVWRSYRAQGTVGARPGRGLSRRAADRSRA